MKILSNNELYNINGGASLMITPLYGFIKVMKYVTKVISSRF